MGLAGSGAGISGGVHFNQLGTFSLSAEVRGAAIDSVYATLQNVRLTAIFALKRFAGQIQGGTHTAKLQENSPVQWILLTCSNLEPHRTDARLFQQSFDGDIRT